MGYYTNHNLTIHQIDNDSIKNDETRRKELEDQINEAISNHSELEYAVGSITEEWPCDVAKWYKHEDDMIEFSKQFPDVVFKLEGKGESCGDMWIQYYKNGFYQHCPAIITFDEYNPDMLEVTHRR